MVEFRRWARKVYETALDNEHVYDEQAKSKNPGCAIAKTPFVYDEIVGEENHQGFD